MGQLRPALRITDGLEHGLVDDASGDQLPADLERVLIQRRCYSQQSAARVGSQGAASGHAVGRERRVPGIRGDQRGLRGGHVIEGGINGTV
jgi:hypothetical protein